jgi:hypothetical protein
MRAYGPFFLAALTTAALPWRSARADGVAWERVPAAPAPAKAKAAPKRIPAREHAPDVVPQELPREKGDPTKTVTIVAANEQANVRHAQGPTFAGPAMCFDEYGTKRALTLHMNVRSATEAIQALHVQRLSAGTDAVTLDMTEAFVDLRTLGSRAVSKTTVTLSRIADGPGGVRVFAARQPDGRVQFVVTGAQSTRGTPALITSIVDASSVPVDHEQTDCGYVHFTLAARAGTGQMAEIIALLPDSPDGRDPDDETDPRAQAARRARSISVVVSLSQLPSEADPLLSVTFGSTQ